MSKLNKSEWIRSQPTDSPAKELVAKAKQQGIELTIQQVYTVRHAAAKAANKPAAKPATKLAPKMADHQPTTTTNGHGTAQAHSVRQEFTRLVIRLGTDEAQKILTKILHVEA